MLGSARSYCTFVQQVVKISPQTISLGYHECPPDLPCPNLTQIILVHAAAPPAAYLAFLISLDGDDAAGRIARLPQTAGARANRCDSHLLFRRLSRMSCNSEGR